MFAIPHLKERDCAHCSFKETYGGVEAQTAPIIAQLNAQSGNAYVTKEYVEKYGLSYEQYERFWTMVNTFTSSVTDVSEPMVKIKSDFFEDCLSGATDHSSEIIQESINLYVKTGNVDMSDGGKLMSCFIGIIQGFLVTGALDKSQVRHVLSDVSNSLEHI